MSAPWTGRPEKDGTYWLDGGYGPEVWLWDGDRWNDFEGTRLTPEQIVVRHVLLGPCVYDGNRP